MFNSFGTARFAGLVCVFFQKLAGLYPDEVGRIVMAILL
jgi:hypothetical protein